MSERPRVAIIGDETLAAECAGLAGRHGLDVVAVATRNERVAAWAREHTIALVDPDHLAAALASLRLDVIFSVANLRVLGDDVLACAPLAVNFHDGPLPAYAGRNVTSWALLAGEASHCVTWHVMTSDVDGGAVLAEEWFAIEPDDTAFTLNARCFDAGARSFPRLAEAIASGTAVPQPPRPGATRLYGRFERPGARGLLDPRRPAAELVRAVRAFDLGPRQANPLGVVRLVVGGSAWLVVGATVEPAGDRVAAVGDVVALAPSGVRIRTALDDLVVHALTDLRGVPVDVLDVCARTALVPGGRLAPPSDDLMAALDTVDAAMARHERATAKGLGRQAPTVIAVPLPVVALTGRGRVPVALPAGAGVDDVLAAIAVWLARWSSRADVVVACADTAAASQLQTLAPLAAPARLIVDDVTAGSFRDLRAAVASGRAGADEAGPWLLDLVARTPALRATPPIEPDVVVAVGTGVDGVGADAPLRFALASDGSSLVVDHGLDALDSAQAGRAAEQIATVLAAGLAAPDRPVTALPMLGAMETALLQAANATERSVDTTATIVSQFAAQCTRTPDAPAVSAGATTWTYRELASRVDVLRTALGAAGVRPGDRVGVGLPRCAELVAAVLAVQQAGAAYVPLDPSYPAERIAFMVDDAHLAALVAEPDVAARLARPELAVVTPTAAHASANASAPSPGEVPAGPAPADAAYVIYTSGSTGTPKGVVLEHRQVVNFFAAMDDVVGAEPPGVWLAVTSLSFDISVLELLWTVTRGFHVVLAAEAGVPAAVDAGTAVAAPRPAVDLGPTTPMAFSFFYFSADARGGDDPYRLLLEGARYADEHGFAAVWTPERHFHDFGGLYPNPTVTGAAVAVLTRHVQIRAGSCVLPLHSPIRVAEDWAMVDQLSHGRVSVAMAAGWHPDDFVLRPEGHRGAREALVTSIRTVQQLWRGETLTFPGPDGKAVEVRTLPRPVQAELPVWMTTAGTPASFELAGREGFHVLTHLLGQRVEDLDAKIALYRKAWRAAGHAGEGTVALMLHTYVGDDVDAVRRLVHGPMEEYLRTAVGLVGSTPSVFPTFAGSGKADDEAFQSLSAGEVGELLDAAANRYLDTSGLFGTPDTVAPFVARLRALGVDEVACLLDFGVDPELVIESFDRLRQVKEIEEARAAAAAAAGPTGALVSGPSAPDARAAAPGSAPLARADADATMADLVARHGVTHLQCTPSLAAMLAADPADRAALGRLRHLLVGGEALPTALAGDLRRAVAGRLTNMYGPTETTIWSLVHEITAVPDGPVPIGRPIANTTVHVLDEHGEPLPIGALGELHIGGLGVARGYLDRPELTAERFVDRPGLGRVYATGDLARVRAGGVVEFAGRRDHQVKLRGHRVELGEIETCLGRHPAVARAVVSAHRGDVGADALVAYVVLRADGSAGPEALRQHVAAHLPDIMVPAHVVVLDELPLTPNGKVDRNALPAPSTVAFAPPGGSPLAGGANPSPIRLAGAAEELVAAVWTEVLGRPVGRDDNFFELGGHSLLAVRVFRRLTDATDAPLALTDIFRFPTVRSLAAHIDRVAAGPAQSAAPSTGADDADGSPAVDAGADRGARRRQAMARRSSEEPGSS